MTFFAKPAVAFATIALAISSAALFAQEEAKEGLAPIANRAQLENLAPRSPNPYVSFLPSGVDPDYRYWNAKLRFDSEDRAKDRGGVETGGLRGGPFAESEPNDVLFEADSLPGAGVPVQIQIAGMTDDSPEPVGGPEEKEENGTLVTASLIDFVIGKRIAASGTIGNGAHGSSGGGTGDFDFYEIFLKAGDLLTVEVLGVGGDEPLSDSIVGIFNATGQFLGGNDDEPGAPAGDFGSFARFTAPSLGTYYVAVGGWLAGGTLLQKMPSDLDDAASGQGVGSEGAYEAIFSLNIADLFSVELSAGDVLGVASNVSADISILDPDGVERQGSTSAVNGIQPPESTLPTGASEVSHVAAIQGTHYIRVRNLDSAGPAPSAYLLTASVTRPTLEAAPGPQVIFLDFDGALINAPALFGQGNNPAMLSGLSAFLVGWGLVPGDENAVIDAIIATVQENLNDLAVANPDAAFELRNSRDDADTFGVEDRVSRLIVGGTTGELGIATIGIAESIDTGNFGHEETAVILLDLLSAVEGGPNSLNQFPLVGGATKIDIVGVGVGNIATHEAGHYLGNWHTDQFNGQPAIQDQGGNLTAFVGAGPDGMFGNGDDVDVDFAEDVFIPGEGFTGIEHQPARTGFGITWGIFANGFESGDTTSWSSTTP